jgi:anti-sigma regulatory factor (Ser/Thr protein kinase)/Pyruvate/2-oxoacid:ferredoxin oxidoreductase delta subunit
MNLGTYRITGNDFERAGSASSGLKEQLKKLGADADIIRRSMIATYEAEMNVVIHARNGILRATLINHQIDVEIIDEGPGIPDIDLAMKEGFSTASSKARELGFGAGMGLPNIKKNSDRLSIQSTVGQGTQVRFTIFLRPQEAFEPGHISVHVVEGRCKECYQCLKACPTKAIRVRKGRPQILEYLCIDCAACLRVCKPGALAMLSTVGLPRLTEDTVLVVPPAFLVQFGPEVHPQRVLAALYKLGFQEVRVTAAREHALRSAVIGYGREESNLVPTISPVCPAVAALIQMRFPSLINNLAPFVSPLEAEQEELLGRHVVYVTSCPCQYTALLARGLAKRTDIISPATLRNAVQPLISAGVHAADDLLKFPGPNPQEEKLVMQVTGIHSVLSILEKVENGLVRDLPVLELFACEGGCFGLPLGSEDPYLAKFRWSKACGQSRSWSRAIRRKEPFVPRSGVRLDKDMTKAIEKLSKIDKLTRTLPGKDCGMCGAPTCAAMAEDITLGRALLQDCIHIKEEE